MSIEGGDVREAFVVRTPMSEQEKRDLEKAFEGMEPGRIFRLVEQPTAHELATFFHDTYEMLAPDFGWTTSAGCVVPFDDLPDENRLLMLEVCERVLQEFGGWVRKPEPPTREPEGSSDPSPTPKS
jgi:hypothetical protein